MTAALNTVLHTLRDQIHDPDDARAYLAQQALAGVDPKALREAWDEWQALHEASVTVLTTGGAA